MFKSFVYYKLCRSVIEESRKGIDCEGWKEFDAIAEIEILSLRSIANKYKSKICRSS